MGGGFHHGHYLLRMKINGKFFPKSQNVMLLFHTPLQSQISWTLTGTKGSERQYFQEEPTEGRCGQAPLWTCRPVPHVRECQSHVRIVIAVPRPKYFPKVHQPSDLAPRVDCKHGCSRPGLRRCRLRPKSPPRRRRERFPGNAPHSKLHRVPLVQRPPSTQKLWLLKKKMMSTSHERGKAAAPGAGPCCSPWTGAT